MATFDAKLPAFDVSKSIILITGGSGGIGLGLVHEFVNRGAKVLITGRREEELKKVQTKYGADRVLKYYVGSTGKESDRIALFQQSTSDYPNIDILINNAGIQNRGDHAEEIKKPWSVRQEEIDVNLSGPIHLTSLFIPHLLKQGKNKPTAIINVTSGLAFVPFSEGPIYSCTKAGLHNYTEALRPLLADTNVRIVEMVPPAVKSNLGGAHAFGEECDEFCRGVVENFLEGKVEFGFKMSDEMRMADRKDLATRLMNINKLRNVKPIQQ